MKLQNVIRVLMGIVCIGLLPRAEGVVPPPDGGYPNFNTAEGQNALFSLTTGVGNTAVGWFSLFSNAAGGFNTATGAGALLLNTAGSNNTAVGAAALLNNIASDNTAIGVNALLSNTVGLLNTAIGYRALLNNTQGGENTAIGQDALSDNTTGFGNTAVGKAAGVDVTGNGNVCVGAGVIGEAGVDNTTWIRNVYNSVATARQVYVDSSNKIGTLASSRRYKDEIRPMANASEAILSLRPVSFRYKKEVDPTRAVSFGLIAEEVAEVDPDLVTSDREGKPQTVRYEAVNAMLLNEFLKEHRKVEAQEATITQLKSTVAQQRRDFQTTVAHQQKQIEALAAGLQKVSAQLEASKPAPQVAENNQ